MKKVIYVYLNDSDLMKIFDIFYQFNITCCNDNVYNIKAVSSHLRKFYFSNNSQTFIKFIPCFYTLNQLQCASFTLDCNDSILDSAFLKIKKHIKLMYTLSPDRFYYIGPGIYQDWIDNKYCFPTLFKYLSFNVDSRNLQLLFDDILNSGNLIKVNNVKLSNIDTIDLFAESFVIYTNNSKMSTTILRKNTIRYEFGSECIFVFRRKYEKFEFVLDHRVYSGSNYKLIKLFESIEEHWSE